MDSPTDAGSASEEGPPTETVSLRAGRYLLGIYWLSLSAGERCGSCNGELRELGDGENRAEYVPDDADPVWVCVDCGQQFYRGSHWRDVENRLP